MYGNYRVRTTPTFTAGIAKCNLFVPAGDAAGDHRIGPLLFAHPAAGEHTTAWGNAQGHPALPIYGMARPRRAHPPDPVSDVPEEGEGVESGGGWPDHHPLQVGTGGGNAHCHLAAETFPIAKEAAKQ